MVLGAGPLEGIRVRQGHEGSVPGQYEWLCKKKTQVNMFTQSL